MDETTLQSPHPILGAFEPDEVFVEYDAPLVFTFRGANENVFLAYLAEAQPGHTVYLAAEIAPGLLAEVARGRAPVGAAFAGKVWVIVIHAGGVIANAVEELVAALPPRYLPPEQLRALPA
jgi:hypothetical protein